MTWPEPTALPLFATTMRSIRGPHTRLHTPLTATLDRAPVATLRWMAPW